MRGRARSILVVAAVALGLPACSMRASHAEWRVNAIREEMRLVLPGASERLACHPGRLDTDLLDEDGRRRTYAVRGCGRSASYRCETGADERNAPRNTTCVDTRSGHTVGGQTR